MYGQQLVTLYTCRSILDLMSLEIRAVQSPKCIVLLTVRQYVFLFPTLIPLSGVGTTCFHHAVIKIRHLFLRQVLEWMLTIANAAGTNGLTCLPKHGGAPDNKVLLVPAFAVVSTHHFVHYKILQSLLNA
jgi:hypothetical protein